MNRFARISSLAIVTILILALAAPAFATESTGESDGGETTTTLAPVPDGEQPSVVIPPVVIEIEEQPWTARFIYPTIAVVTVLLIAGVAIGYNSRIRKKYRVVG